MIERDLAQKNFIRALKEWAAASGARILDFDNEAIPYAVKNALNCMES